MIFNPTVAQQYVMYGDSLYYEAQAQTARTSHDFYGQGTYRLTPKLSIVAGARYTSEVDTQSDSSYFAVPVFTRSAYDSLTGKISATYQFAKSNSLYATYSTGVKPGGTNLSPSALLVPQAFAHESVGEIEVGSKNEFLDKRVRLNIAAFYNDYRNMQLNSDDYLPFEGGVSNVGRVATYGLEIEGSASLPYGFHLDGNAATLGGRVLSHTLLVDPWVTAAIDTKYGYFSPTDLALRFKSGEDVYGKTPPKLPPFSTFLALSHTDELPFGGTLQSRIQGNYRSGYEARVFNEAAIDNVPSMYQLGMSFRYEPPKPSWYAELVVVNLTGNNAINSRVADVFGGGNVANIYVPPQQFIGRLGFRF